MIESLIISLYALNIPISIFGYVPQVIKLIKAKEPTTHISLMSWFTWMYAWIVQLLYAIFILADSYYISLAAVIIVCHLSIIILIIYNRYFRFN